MLEFHLDEIGLFDTARSLDPHLDGLARFVPQAAGPMGEAPAGPLGGAAASDLAQLPAVEAECRRDRLALLDATDEAYLHSAQGRAFAAWLAGARPAELICTRKGDTSLDDVHRYIVRDAVQWLTLWSAGYRRDPLWHAIAKAVALLAVLDDVVVPPQDVASGAHRLGGESLAEVLDRVHALGGDRDRRWLAEAYRETLFSARIQFHEKWSAAGPGLAPPARFDAIQAYVREPDILRASILRTYAAETLPVMGLIAYYFRLPFDECDRAAFLAAGVAQTLGMDISKDQYGIGVKEVTNFGVRPGRREPENARQRTAIYRTFLRLTAQLHNAADLAGVVYDRYSRVSLSYARLVDRYLERRRMTRLPMNDTLSAVVNEVIADG
ncbi:hypothetical protein [Kitasatospora brasiliensis]|uniref:hypothetical protein n=1 Tax=Kitasatospora brasiliensis TaxID=3058040 RepID=UPI00292E5D59|nr:hypothetical protein [Kitasatospora sp. K002]